MNRSTAVARAVIAELRAVGVRDYVLAPGSRNAPFALALAEAERNGDVRLHVRIDERGAGFLALGLAKGSAHPVAVVTTSGTAAVELHPAMVEAHHCGVPLVAVTADRPAAVRGTGASQTIDQPGIYAATVRSEVDVPVDAGAEVAAEQVRAALATLTGPRRGPVHLNVQLAPPLVPDPGEPFRLPAETPTRLPLKHESTPLTDVLRRAGLDAVPERGLVLLGDTQGAQPLAIRMRDLAGTVGWPVISETAGGGPFRGVLPHGPLLLESAEFLAANTPELLVTVGAFGLTRAALALAERVPVHIAVSRAGLPADPARTAKVVVDGVIDAGGDEPGPQTWLRKWRDASFRAGEAVTQQLRRGFTGPAVAAEVWSAARDGEPLLVAASWSVRAMAEVATPRSDPPLLLVNRGTNGIDGLVATAWGTALGSGRPTTALIGDLAFLYDVNSLARPTAEGVPDLTLVVVDNDGGGIFHQLEQGAPAYAEHFERVFGTPHELDLAAIGAAFDVPVQRVSDRDGLRTALAVARASGGLQLVVADVGGRTGEWRALQELRDAVRAALAG